MKILLVEDDARVASFIRRGLKEENYIVDHASDGEMALEMAQMSPYDLMIFDVMIPKKSGIEVLKEIRASKINTPVMLLTAKDEVQDKVQGLNAGADDYLTKPFSFEELLARVRALLRRQGNLLPSTLKLLDLELDTQKHRATRAGKEIILTNREYTLLEFFLTHSNQIVTRTMLAENVWEQDFDPMSNVIDVHVARLRRKIDDDHKTKLLDTIRGKGYILKDPQQC